MAQSKRYLVECMGNTCRSAMIAPLIEAEMKKLGIDVVVESCGYGEPAKGAMPAAAEWGALKDETGIDLSDHRSRHVSQIGDPRRFDRIIVVDPAALESLKDWNVPEDRILVVDVPNPYQAGRPLAEGVPVYRDAFQAYVREVVPAIMAKLAA